MDELRLRKLDFPQSARECLAQLEKFLSQQRNQSVPTGRMAKDLQTAIDEHLFCVTDRRAIFCPRLSCAQDLQLLLLMVNHYAAKSDVDSRGRAVVFEVLFNPRESDVSIVEHRQKMLFRLVSLSIQLRCSPFLTEFANWMQKPKNFSQLNPLAVVLLEDFCQTGLNPAVDRSHLYSAFHDVITLCPNFALISFAAVTKGIQRRTVPPQPLLEIFTEWLASPKPLVKAFRDVSKELKVPNALFDGVSATVVMLLWTCCAGPVHPATTDFQRQLMFKLHAVLLQFLLLIPKSSANSSLVDIRAKDIVEFLEFLNESATDKSSASLSLCLDRLTMGIQIAQSSGCFSGSKKEVERNFSSRFSHESFQQVLRVLP